MSQRFERVKTTAEIGWLRIRHLVHTVLSAVAIGVLLAGVAALFGPIVVAEVPPANVIVEPLITASSWVPLSAVAEIILGIVAVGLLYRL